MKKKQPKKAANRRREQDNRPKWYADVQVRQMGPDDPSLAAFEEGEPITDELLEELAAQGKPVPPQDAAYLKQSGARYIRSRGSFSFGGDNAQTIFDALRNKA